MVWICLLGAIDAIRDGKAEGGVAHKGKILYLGGANAGVIPLTITWMRRHKIDRVIKKKSQLQSLLLKKLKN